MIATDLLKQQHREFEELMRQIETAEDDDERVALRVELADMFAAHTAVEEELFYPAALDQLGPASRIRESLEEHAVADFALYRLMSVSVADETFAAKLATLKDVVMNHLEEEESELLPQVDGEMDRQVLEQLGEKMAARFEERLHEGHRAILERSLGITARQAPVVAQAAPAKKAAPARRRTTKVKASPQKQAMAAVKRGSAPKRATTKRTKPVKPSAISATSATSAKKTSARAENGTKVEAAPTRSNARQSQAAAARAPQKTTRRTTTRGQTTAKKSRATG